MSDYDDLDKRFAENFGYMYDAGIFQFDESRRPIIPRTDRQASSLPNPEAELSRIDGRLDTLNATVRGGFDTLKADFDGTFNTLKAEFDGTERTIRAILGENNEKIEGLRNKLFVIVFTAMAIALTIVLGTMRLADDYYVNPSTSSAVESEGARQIVGE